MKTTERTETGIRALAASLRGHVCRSWSRPAARALPILASLCLMVSAVLPCRAAEGRYTYTVVFHAGEQGALSTEDGVSISVDGGGGYEIQADEDGKTVRITGLTAENHVRFLNSAVSLGEDSKYYVKGVRMGGRDNSTVALSYFPVERDQDYVVAYGIKGDMTQYTVYYVDTAGNNLLPPQVYYGNVGDKPVVAYLYIEGYRPQAYNLTRTLQKDYSKNIFTFVYSRIPTPAPDGGGTNPGGTTPGGTDPGGTTPGGTDPGGTTPGGTDPGGTAPGGTEPGGTTPDGGGAGTPGAGGGTAPGGAAGPGGEGGDGGAQPPEGEDNPGGETEPGGLTTVDEEGNELGEPQDLEDLDDEETPLGGYEGGTEDDGTIAAANRARRRGTLLAAGIGIAAVLLLAAGLYLYRRIRKSQARKSDGE